jgi:excisionase family DNA binding protein
MNSQTTVPGPLLVGTADAAKRLGVSYIWLKREVSAGRVQHTRHGRLVKFSEDDLAAFITARKVPAVNRPA